MTKKGLNITKKTLGMTILVGLIIQYVFPAIKLGNLSWIATIIYLLVAFYLLFF